MICTLAIEAIAELEGLLAEVSERGRAPISNWAKIYVGLRFYDGVQDLRDRLQVFAELREDALAFDAVIKQTQDTKDAGVSTILHSYATMKRFRSTFQWHSFALKFSMTKVFHHGRDAIVFDAAKKTGYANKVALTDYLAQLLEGDEDEESRIFNSYAKISSAFATSFPKTRRRRCVRKGQRTSAGLPETFPGAEQPAPTQKVIGPGARLDVASSPTRLRERGALANGLTNGEL